jgi:streptogramin lyase
MLARVLVFVVVGGLGLPGPAAAQTITEIIDVTGDGAGNALGVPRAVASDAAGTVYVSGAATNNAFSVTPAGVITEIIDEMGDGAGNPLLLARALAVDTFGNVYVTGQNSNNAFKITPGGVITEIIDATGDGAGNTLADPRGIAVDGSGNVYVGGFGTGNVFKITPGGVITEIIDATGDGAGNTLEGAFEVAATTSGVVYVAGLATDNVFEITPGGMITEIIDSTGDGAGNVLDDARGVAVDATGNVYVSGAESDNAFRITPDGLITELIDATGDGRGNLLEFPQDVAVDASGNVYVPGSFSSNAFEITPDGVITEIIDATGDGGGNALAFANGNAVDALGNVYQVGENSNNVFRITGTTAIVPLDIKPGACPNPYNPKSNGVLKVALLGTPDLDISMVDREKPITIRRADGTGGSIEPNEGPPGPKSKIKDAGEPLVAFPCACHDAGPDGIDDLVMFFKSGDMADVLELHDVGKGVAVGLVVEGKLLDGTDFDARDCIHTVPLSSPPGMLVVAAPGAEGAWIDITPVDKQDDGGGFGSFRRAYRQSTRVHLTAAPSYGGRAFLGWVVDGQFVSADKTLDWLIRGAVTYIHAYYEYGTTLEGTY